MATDEDRDFAALTQEAMRAEMLAAANAAINAWLARHGDHTGRIKSLHIDGILVRMLCVECRDDVELRVSMTPARSST